MSSAETTGPTPQQALEGSRRIDEVCSKFVQALRRGERPRIEDVLKSNELPSSDKLLRELLLHEMEFQSKAGQSPTLESYRVRFPEHARLVKYVYHEYFIPTEVGEFSIQKLLGRGGFGHVYQAWDARLMRTVAVKVFRRDPTRPTSSGNSLLAEARSAAQLRHPSVVTVYGVHEDLDGDEFLVLEYVDGRSLENLLRTERVSAREAASMVLAVAEALQEAHHHGLVHRDLKPDNILLDRDRCPRVTDFGLALHLATARPRHELVGTLAYMAPEQASGETHRLDARTDLWAVGVILYRLLSGRLPFEGEGRHELLEAIRHSEPRDLRQLVPDVPQSLVNIVNRCLAKRMSERYQSAAEFIDDLEAYLHAPAGGRRGATAVDQVETALAIVPKGLRCFDASDRDFFLQLVPGPRDRHGIPKAVRFWEQNLQETDAHQAFRVGVLYGPSGCGKSSLVRAGILPRLPRSVRTVLIEATREETEARLARELLRQFPGLSADLTLPEMVCELREDAFLAPGEKLVLIFDQFEQWLHGWLQDQTSPLVEALRQCDGTSIQALILVRDDFWMPVTRFFRQLDVNLAEGVNASAVDLFDQAHATKVLTAFGVSYGRIPPDSSLRSDDQRQFIDRAVADLMQDGWIVPVRLCIFAEMVKSRPWTPVTLRVVGGAHGLGTVFLEEVFDSRSSSPMHRLHRQAARLVLERLLPPPGTEIRGHSVAEPELRAVSGYAQRSDDFAALMRCLDQELRLITPSERQDSSESDAVTDSQSIASDRFYQLTHDYLVTAIRGWLNSARRSTRRGRAELALSDYADTYAAHPETRQLPSWWEWATFLTLTRPRNWRAGERALMQRLARRHGWRSFLAIAATALLALAVYDRMSAIHADGLVQALKTTDSRELRDVVPRLTDYSRWTRPKLYEELKQNPDHRTELLLGLMAVGEDNTAELEKRLLEAPPALVVSASELLQRFGKLEKLEPRLWTLVVNDKSPPDQRLRACVALARLEPSKRADRWQAAAPGLTLLVLHDVAANPQHFASWAESFSPLRKWLIPSLQESFTDKRLPAAEQALAANLLAQYTVDDVPKLMELALQSPINTFEVFSRLLGKQESGVREKMVQEASVDIPAKAPEDEKDRVASRRANAILILHAMGDDQLLWPELRHQPDPRLRSFVIHDLQQLPMEPDKWLARLNSETDAGIRQALIQIIGGQVQPANGPSVRTDLVETMLRIYRDDVDSGVHSAAEWTLRRLGREPELQQAMAELAAQPPRPDFHWYVTKSKLTMVIVDRPGRKVFGSPETEPFRDKRDETTWTGNIDWAFAICTTEITQSLYNELMKPYSEYLNESASKPDCPANAMHWLDALSFCRALSIREGIPEEDLTNIRAEDLSTIVFPHISEEHGYRLPAEVEWEVACRAGTTTPRFFGYAPDLLSDYACYIVNSGGSTWPVGTGQPNPLGLFDVYGNVSEWCYDVHDPLRFLKANEPAKAPKLTSLSATSIYHVARGNEYLSTARMLRSANRYPALPGQASTIRGIRITRTLRRDSAK